MNNLSQRSRWEIIAWSTGQIAIQIFRDVPSLLLLFFMAQVLGISPALAGSAIFAPKLIVAVLADLGAGWLSDRLRQKQQRAGLLIAGAIVAPALLIWLFQPPTGDTETARAAGVALVLTAYMIVFSLFSVPHLALGTQISESARQRTEAMAWRTAMSAVGLLVAASMAPILVDRFGGGADGYAKMSWILAGICTLTLITAWFGSRRIDSAVSNATAARPARSVEERCRWKALLADRATVGLASAFLAQLCAMGMAYATLAFLFSFNLAFAQPLETIGIMVLLVSVVAMSIQPLWVAVAGRIGRRGVYIIGLLGYTFALCFIAFAPSQNAAWVYVGGAIMGMFQSACFTMVFAMLADVIARDEERCGESRSGFFSSLFTIIDKVGFALGGTLIVGLVLQWSGFVAGQPTQSDGALAGIVLGFAILPAVFNLLSLALIVWLYPADTKVD